MRTLRGAGGHRSVAGDTFITLLALECFVVMDIDSNETTDNPASLSSLSRVCYVVTSLHQFSKVSRNFKRVVGDAVYRVR